MSVVYFGAKFWAVSFAIALLPLKYSVPVFAAILLYVYLLLAGHLSSANEFISGSLYIGAHKWQGFVVGWGLSCLTGWCVGQKLRQAKGAAT